MGVLDKLKEQGGVGSFGGFSNPLGMYGGVKSRFEKDMQPGGLLGPSKDQAQHRALQQQQSRFANNFANVGEQGYGQMSAESERSRDYLRRLARGEGSVSAEQLRQANQQTLAAQRSMAASASPYEGPMAARTAMMNMNRASTGLAGQQAVAGLQERQAAQQALANMILQQRQQDAQVALGSRQNANAALGAYKPEASNMEKAASFLPILPMVSDRRLKEDIEAGDNDANAALKGLRSYTYRYKDQKHGQGKQLGVMAQDLEKAGLKQAVMETPIGKVVDAGKLAGANTSMLAALERRVAKMESGKK